MTRHGRKGMDMKPTDDELEATAAKFDVMRAAYEAAGVNGEYGAETMDDAAAMLRACKGRVRVKALEWYVGHSEVQAFARAETIVGLYQILSVPTDSDHRLLLPDRSCQHFTSYTAAKAAAQADYEARIIAALEPAPGYLEGWNDAPEAAANACENIRGLGFVDVSAIGPMPIDQIIRALKKGPTNE